MHRTMIAATIFTLAWALPPATSASAESIPEQVARLQKELDQLAAKVSQLGGGTPGKLPGSFELFDAKGKLNVALSAAEAGGYADLYNVAGKRVTFLGATDERGGMLTLGNTGGEELVEISVTDVAGGYGRFSNGAGKLIAYVGSRKEGGGGFATFYNKNGKEVVLIGTADDQENGTLVVNGIKVRDYAEVFELADRSDVRPGTIMAVSGASARIAPAAAAYDKRVVGVISGAGGLGPGAVVGSREDGTNDLPLAVSGQVFVRVCLEGGPIAPGDLLVASSLPGVAMRAADLSRAAGAVVGKALEDYGKAEPEEGLVRMMVMLR